MDILEEKMVYFDAYFTRFLSERPGKLSYSDQGMRLLLQRVVYLTFFLFYFTERSPTERQRG